MKSRTIAADDPSLLGEIVDEIFDRLQQGEDINIASLAARYPEYHERLKSVLPILKEMNSLQWPVENSGCIDRQLATAQQPTLGDFRLLHQIGRGGMGVVYAAQQLTINRKVAVKILPMAALVDSRALQRFKNEVAAIATLEHPHIVSVYSIGEERGIHYYAMQLIQGQSLAAVISELHARTHQSGQITGASLNQVVSNLNDNLPADQSSAHTAVETVAQGQSRTASGKVSDPVYFRNVTRLMLQAADALQHAHDHGIVHRDVKPANLLLDTNSHLFVTDFGLARIETGAGVTMTGDIMGTLRYMSPEQTLANRVVIDHRTDVYSLGVTLYELLTLQPMWSGNDKAELIRQITFEDPIEPRRVNPSIPSDLNTIVLKAINKNPGERYQHAQLLADDLQRYLDHKPIVARHPTLMQRVAKWSRRNQPIVIASLVVLLLATASLAVSNMLIRQQKEIAEQKTNEAQRESRYARAIADFVKNDFLALTTPDGQERFDEFNKYDLNESSTFRELLDRAAVKIEARKDLDPGIKADLCWIIGVNYRALGENNSAIDFLNRSVKLNQDVYGAFGFRTLESRLSLATAYAAAEQLDAAIPLATEVFERSVQELGVDHEFSISSELSLGVFHFQNKKPTEASVFLERVLPKLNTKFGQDDERALLCLHYLGSLYFDQGRTEEGLRMLQHVLDRRKATLGVDHEDTLRSMVTLGQAYRELFQYEESLTLLEDQLQLRIAKLGEKHPDTLTSIHHLGWVYRDANQLDRAQQLFERVYEARKEVLGVHHRQTLMSMEALGEVYLQTGRSNAGLSLLQAAIDLYTEQFGESHEATLGCMRGVAWHYENSGQFEKALPMFRRAVEITEQKLGLNHPDTIENIAQLAWAFNNAGYFHESIPLFEQIVGLNNEGHPATLADGQNLAWKHNSLFYLAWAHNKVGRLDVAIPLFEQALELKKASLGENHRKTLACMRDLGTAYALDGQLDRSLALLKHTEEVQFEELGERDPDTLLTQCHLGEAFRLAGRTDDALQLLMQVADALMRTQGAAHPYTMLARSQLAATHRIAGNPGQALPVTMSMADESASSRGEHHLDTICIMNSLASTYLQLESEEKAEELLRQILKIVQLSRPNHWARFYSSSMLGEALMRQGRFADAELSMLEGYHGLVDNQKIIPPFFRINSTAGHLIGVDVSESETRVTESIERLIQLYDAWHEAEPDAGYDREARAWRIVLEEELGTIDDRNAEEGDQQS